MNADFKFCIESKNGEVIIECEPQSMPPKGIVLIISNALLCVPKEMRASVLQLVEKSVKSRDNRIKKHKR